MDEEAEKSLSERFFKERRLFLAVSVVLLAHQILGISATSDFDSLGLKFTVAKPDRLFDAAWAVWWWGLICYLQQLYSLRPFKQFPTERRNEVQDALNRRYVAFHVWRRVRASFRRQVKPAHRLSYEVGAPQLIKDRREIGGGGQLPDAILVGVVVRWSTVPDEPRAVTVLDDQGATGVSDIQESIRWIVRHGSYAKHNEGLRSTGGTIEIPLGWVSKHSWIGACATLWTWMAASFVSDYLAPLVVGLAPAAIWAWGRL
jgi:hypothetical protein